MSAAGALIATVVQVVAGPTGAGDIAALREAAEDGARWVVGATLIPRDRRSLLEDRVRACGPQNDCIAARFEGSGADFGVLVVANYAASPPLATVEVFTPDKREPVVQELVELSVEPVRGTLERAVERALLAADNAVGGQVSLHLEPGDASVTVDPDVSIGRERPALAPGPYVLHIARSGYVSTSTTVNVAVRRITEATVRLEPTKSPLEQWWFWAAVGTVVVAVGVTTALVVTRPDTVEVCHPVGGPSC